MDFVEGGAAVRTSVELIAASDTADAGFRLNDEVVKECEVAIVKNQVLLRCHQPNLMIIRNTN